MAIRALASSGSNGRLDFGLVCLSPKGGSCREPAPVRLARFGAGTAAMATLQVRCTWLAVRRRASLGKACVLRHDWHGRNGQLRRVMVRLAKPRQAWAAMSVLAQASLPGPGTASCVALCHGMAAAAWLGVPGAPSLGSARCGMAWQHRPVPSGPAGACFVEVVLGMVRHL